MEIRIRHAGGTPVTPAKFIEMTIVSSGTTLTTDITDLDGKIDEDFISSLKIIIDECEDQNRLITELTLKNYDR